MIDTAITRFTRRRLLQCFSAAALGSAVPNASAKHEAGSPVWEIRSERGRVFLLAHTPPRPDDWKESRIENLLRDCAQYWNETSHKAEASVQELMKRYGIDRNRALWNRLDSPQSARLAAAAQAVGIPKESLANFRPWLAGQSLEDALFSAPGFNKRNADSVLEEEARRQSIPVSNEFPTIDATARWFAGLPPDAEIQYLLYVLDEVLMGHEKGQQIYAEWASGIDTRATAWVTRMMRLYPQLYRSIVLERNEGWIPRVRAMLQAGKSSMIVVGFYHLVGPDRIQVQLAKAGLTLQKI